MESSTVVQVRLPQAYGQRMLFTGMCHIIIGFDVECYKGRNRLHNNHLLLHRLLCVAYSMFHFIHDVYN